MPSARFPAPRFVSCGVLLAGVLAATVATAEPWVVRAGREQLVRFRSKAPLETFEGKTDVVNGTLVLDTTSIRAKFSIEIRVDLASLDTTAMGLVFRLGMLPPATRVRQLR